RRRGSRQGLPAASGAAASLSEREAPCDPGAPDGLRRAYAGRRPGPADVRARAGRTLNMEYGAPGVLLAALVIDAIVGDPRWLWRRLPHPVAIMGQVIALLDRTLNRDHHSEAMRRLAGVAAIAAIVVTLAVTG